MADGNLVRPSGADLDAVLAEAHLPSLMMALVHLTGNTDHLTEARRPVYEMFGDGQGGLPQAEQAAVRALAKETLQAFFAGDGTLPPPPPAESVRFMMDFIAGVPIPERYVPFLMEELNFQGDPKEPRWDTPKLKAAAAKMKVLIIGAGMSGLLSAIRLTQAGVDWEIVEKNPDVGGTWFENTYPGCRVDSPNHTYSYSFEPNHHWPNKFSTQDVLLEYFQRTADKHGLREKIRFETQVEEARWDESANQWKVTVRGKDGATEVIAATAVISAVGQLNQPQYPNLPGRESFQGESFHSARWRHDVDLTGKKVIVIGTGASAFQFVPEIAPKVADLTIFQRTPPWLAVTADYHDEVGSGQQWLLEHVPFYDKWHRFWLFWMSTDGVLEACRVDPAWEGADHSISVANDMVRMMLVEHMRAQLQDRQDLLPMVTPHYPFGGKRALRDNGVWLAALKRDNVKAVTDPLAEITPTGVRTESGQAYDADVIIYGTGFTASSFLSTFKVYGRGGVELHEKWDGDARAYLGMTTPGFPNFFMIYGPNTNIVVNGSIFFFSEASVRYIVESLKLLGETGAAALEPKPEVHDAFNAKVDAANQRMAWGYPGVTSWYKNEKGRVSQNWPFLLVDYWEATRAPNPDDFVLS